MTHASRFAFLPERLAAINRNACATCSLHHALIELKDNPVRILEQARQILVRGGFAEAGRVNLARRHQHFDPCCLEFVMHGAKIVDPP